MNCELIKNKMIDCVKFITQCKYLNSKNLQSRFPCNQIYCNVETRV